MNIPVSPSSKTQLHYMGLELQGASAGIRGGSPRGGLPLPGHLRPPQGRGLPPPPGSPPVHALAKLCPEGVALPSSQLSKPPQAQVLDPITSSRPRPLREAWATRGFLEAGGMGAAGPAHPGLLPGAGASRYAQIDITATEAAHRVGAQHAQSREERLPELERRRKGALR